MAADLDRDGQPDATVSVDSDGDSKPDREIEVGFDHNHRPIKFIDVDGDTRVDGDNLENIFGAVIGGRPFPVIDWTMIGFLSAFVAISGQGGLSNTPISNYTRDQGWGWDTMSAPFRAWWGDTIFSSLTKGPFLFRLRTRGSLEGLVPPCAARPKPASGCRLFFRTRAAQHALRRLPERGFQVANEYETTANDGRTAFSMSSADHWGPSFWYMTLFGHSWSWRRPWPAPSTASCRRWVDVFWTSSKYLRSLESGKIKYVYFLVLTVYASFRPHDAFARETGQAAASGKHDL